MMTALWGPIRPTHSDCSSSANRDDCKAVIDNYIYIIIFIIFILFEGFLISGCLLHVILGSKGMDSF